MARNQNSKKEYLPVEKVDIEEYLTTTSDDFLFEMNALKILQSAGFKCRHSGYYSDSETGKLREFDIRAAFRLQHIELDFSVECKNFSDPVVIYRTCHPKSLENKMGICGSAVAQKRIEKVSLAPSDEVFLSDHLGVFAIYEKNIKDEYVGRSSALIRKYESNDICSFENGRDAYDYMSQSISSATDWVKNSQWNHEAHIFLPILIVPDHKLWVVDFDDKGVHTEPKQVESCYYYIGREISASYISHHFLYKMPFLRILTQRGLSSLVCNRHNLFDVFFVCGSFLIKEG